MQTNSSCSHLPAEPVGHIHPVDGWQLCRLIERDSDGFDFPTYVARKGDQEVDLAVSRFRFSPSQARFAWLVHAGFPASPNIGPWDDTDIELRMAVPEMAV